MIFARDTSEKMQVHQDRDIIHGFIIHNCLIVTNYSVRKFIMENFQPLSAILPDFNAVQYAELPAKLERLLTENRQKIHTLLQQSSFTWDNLMRPLELIAQALQNMWSPIEQLNSTMNTPELREAYNACLPKLTEYHTELAQNEKLYKAIRQIAESPEFATFSVAQKQILKNDLRDFKLSGIDLPADKKQRFAKLQQQHALLTTKFEENLLDSTKSWSYHTKDQQELSGLPEWAVQMAANTAAQENKTGWILTLDFPVYYAVMNYADNRALREKFYRAYVTRASDQAENKSWDNSQVMLDILQVRFETAHLLGFTNYAELSLATKMAESPTQVLGFLNQLAQHGKPYAEHELEALKNFAQKQSGISELCAWDFAYYSEKFQQTCYSISQEQLRVYFPETKVWQGLSEIVRRLYGIQIKQVTPPSTWHANVKLYAIENEEEQVVGYFYTDLYARPDKHSGAWVGECRNRYYREDQSLQVPVAYLNCNFTAPNNDQPCLMTHDDVITLFHEFGHTLHHLLSQVNFAAVSGFNGVAWDAVELPSQFMENWCWQVDAIPLISAHHQTGESLPADLLDKLLAAKNFQVGMQMMRQLELALFDFRLHMEYQAGDPQFIQSLLDQVRQQVSVLTPPAFNRFQHGFSHIFAGGYAAGYYSYKWAEVLSSDAFSRFEEEGIFNTSTGHDFLRCILHAGGSEEAMELFKRFRGREPEISHLLRHAGISH